MEGFLDGFLNEHCPLKTFRSKELSPVWLTHDVIMLSLDRDRAWAKALQSDDENDWALARRLRNWANNAVKAAKANFLRNELETNHKDPKKFWRNIKDVLPDQSSGIIDIKNPLKEQQAQEVNNFFANIGSGLSTKFGPETLDLRFENAVGNGEELHIEPISQPEVVRLIGSISVYKSSGIDNVSARVIKDFLSLISRELTLLFNNILETGVFPDKWKMATVTPIPKVSNATLPTELRPISLLPIPGKLLEKYITKNIVQFLEAKEFFSDSQSGFRKGKSTAGATSKLLDKIICDLNDSKTSVAAYLDVQKAFDSINHNILLRKLRSCGLGVQICTLLRNYLHNRAQKTKLHNAQSDLKPVRIGVPQGSTLGPVLFIIYINDLAETLENVHPYMYADDTVLYFAHNNRKTLRKKMQCDLNAVEKWFTVNRLSLNISKTKVMTFMSDHKRKNELPLRFLMKGKIIDEVNCYKYLGTTLDNRLSGDSQHSKLTQTLSLKLRTFGRIRRFLTTGAALTVYKSTILPLIDYNDHFQQLWNLDKLYKLQRMQNWGLRIVYFSDEPKPEENELHTKANLMLLKHRRVLHLLSVMYHRSKNNRYLDDRNLNTRQFAKIKFKVINPVIKKAFQSTNYRGAMVWDKLPLDTQTAPTFASFKRKVKAHITAGLYNEL